MILSVSWGTKEETMATAQSEAKADKPDVPKAEEVIKSDTEARKRKIRPKKEDKKTDTHKVEFEVNGN
jgi:hypothetical protein